MSVKSECPHCRGPLELVLSVKAGARLGDEPRVSKRTEPTEEETALITEFRSAYLQSVDKDYKFKIPFPAAEVRAARQLLRAATAPGERGHLSAVISWTVGDKFEPAPGSQWAGWAHVVRSVANLLKHFPQLDKKTRAAMQGRAA